LSKQNKSFNDDLLAVDLVLRDGVKLHLKFSEKEQGENLNGTDLIPEILKKAGKGKRLVVFGTTLDVIGLAKPKLEELGVTLVTASDGFQTIEHYIEQATKYEADIYLLAMGMPKQERVAKILKQNLKSGVIICGGAIIDFMGGKVTRAPSMMRNGLEWLYRLFKEPKRLFQRYVIGNLRFLSSCLRTRF
jgi:exopolysaccharide biosynthesis WecB/TagA/CpsF family protein